MTQTIRFHETGAPDVLRLEDIPLEPPQAGFVTVRHAAIGVNYIDTYHRTGLYPVPLPSGLGVEAAGVVEEVGEGVSGLKPGDRVAYAGGPPGSYAERRNIAASLLVPLPSSISDVDAASLLLQGLTVRSLIHRTYPVKPGDTVLWHAAAGGVGLIACQWLRAMDVEVIGTVSSVEKGRIAKAAGCEHVIVYTQENFVDRVKKITGGQGVPVVFDSVGKTTWEGSLDCLRPLGTMVSFGNSSGAVPPFALSQLASKGSLFVTRPVLGHYVAQREDLEAAARDLFDVVAEGRVKAHVRQRFQLAQAAQAHAALESRSTVGATVLLP